MSLKAFWDILRPFNCVMAGFAAIIGVITSLNFYLTSLALIFIDISLITGAGHVINDYYDRQIDAINRPNRPIPSGRISPSSALTYSIALFAAGCILASLVNKLYLTMAIIDSILLLFYARDFKAKPLVGNICVSCLMGSSFFLGGIVSGVDGLLANKDLFLITFFAGMSREIIKDIEDIEGDRFGGAKTLPIIAGEKLSAALATAFALITIIFSYFVPFGKAYLLVISLGNLFFLFSVQEIIKGNAKDSQKLQKVGMSIALLAFFLGTLQRLSIIAL